MNQENQLIINEYLELAKTKGVGAFQGVIGHATFQNVEDFNIVLSLTENQPYLISCNNVSAGTIDKFLKIKHSATGSFHFRISFFAEKYIKMDRLQKILNLNSKNLKLLTIRIYCNTMVSIREQQERLWDLFEVISQIPVKYQIIFKLAGHHIASVDLEKLRLKWLTSALEAGYQVIRLVMHIDSTSLYLNPEWAKITNLVKLNGVSLSAVFRLRKWKDEVNIDVLETFLSSLDGSDNQLILKETLFGNFVCYNLRECVISIVESEQFPTIYFPQDGRLVMGTSLSGVRSLLLSIKNGWQIRVLKLIKRDLDNEMTLLTSDEKALLFVLLDELLPQFENLFEVTLNNENIEDVGEEGRNLYVHHLSSRTGDYLSFLIQQRRKGKYNRAKVMVMGDGQAGKTSTIRSLSGEVFNPEHVKTVVAARAEVVDLVASTWKSMSERHTSVTTFQRDLKFVSASVVKEKEGEGNFQPREDTEIKKPIMLPKLSPSHVLKRALQESSTSLALTHQASLDEDIDITAQLELEDNPLKLTIWDFGGQRIFDALHVLYLTDGSIYYVVFNMRKFADNLTIEAAKLHRWLSSLSLYAPNGYIFLIGTRAEVVTEEELKKIDEELENVLKAFYSLNIISNEELSLLFFPVDNSLGDKNEVYLKPIKDEVRKVLMNEEETDAPWNKKVELSWMFFMHHYYSEGNKLVSTDSIQAEGLKYGFSVEEIEEMLSFFNSVGALLNYSSLFEKKDQPSIVMNPEWLLEVLGEIIMVRERNKLKKIGRTKRDGSKFFVPFLKDTGIFAELVLDHLLSSIGVTEAEKVFVTTLCEKKLIMARLREIPTQTRVPREIQRIKTNLWVVPSFFSKEIRGKEMSLISQRRMRRENFMRKEIMWAPVVPSSLFESFCCCIVKHGRENRSFRFNNLNGNLLTAELQGCLFEVEFFAPSIYFLNLYSTDSVDVAVVSELIRVSYLNACSLGLTLDISEDCEFSREQPPRSNRTTGNIQRPLQRVAANAKFDCFLSHRWKEGGHEKVVQISSLLESRGLKVWLDEKHMKGDDINRDMQKGIDESKVFLAFLTTAYLQGSSDPKNNAGKEFRYAANVWLERIILVVLDENLTNPDSWNKYQVRFYFPGALFVDFSTEEKINSNLDTLIRRITEKTQL